MFDTLFDTGFFAITTAILFASTVYLALALRSERERRKDAESWGGDERAAAPEGGDEWPGWPNPPQRVEVENGA